MERPRRYAGGGGHFSGRLTAPLCIAGGIAKQLLARRGIYVGAHLFSVGSEQDESFPLWPTSELFQAVSEKPFPVLDDKAGERMRALILEAKNALDSVGGVIECAAVGLPAGLGDPMFDGVENRLAAALFGIPAVKGVEFGAGFQAARLRGSEHNDPFIIADGRLYGYNTDIFGFLYMARRAGISFGGKKVTVLGSGGASLTVQAAARREGAREVVVISRNGPDNYENLEHHADAEVLVNATPVGMWPDLGGQPVDLERLPRLEAVMDLIYNPIRTNLLLQAERMDIRRAGGLSMLVHQAVAAEERFFDRPIPDSETERIFSQLGRDQANIVLVGMPGCGKTTVGMELARAARRPFIDLDDEVVRMAGKSIPEIFSQEGEEAFRTLERQVLAEACGKSGQVVATGGGSVLSPENRAAVRRTGRVYFLRRDLDRLAVTGRPLSVKGTLEEMYRQRLPLYEETADAAIDNSASVSGTAELVWRDFSSLDRRLI